MNNHPEMSWDAYTIKEYVHAIVKDKIELLFKDNNLRLSNESTVTGGMIGKLNALYTLKLDLLSDTVFYNPVGVAHINNFYPIHPGGTRLMFAENYHKPMPVIITDYDGGLPTKFPHLNLQTNDHITLDLTEHNLRYILRTTDTASECFRKSLNYNSDQEKIIEIQQFTDPEDGAFDLIAHHPTTYNPPRKFARVHDRIFVNDMPILRLVDDMWCIDMGTIPTSEIKPLVDNTVLYSESEKFDSRNGVTTYSANLTLRQIWDNFLIKNPEDTRYYADDIDHYVHYIMVDMIEHLFSDGRTERTSDDPELTTWDIGKCNSLYKIKCELESGMPIRNPICITALKNGLFPIHPGGTRLMYSDVYHATVPVMLTDQTGTLIRDYSHIQFNPIEELNFEFEHSGLAVQYSQTEEAQCPTAYRQCYNIIKDEQGEYISKMMPSIEIQQVVDYLVDAPDYTYHKPKLCNPPRVFKYDKENDRVLVDGKSILKRVNGLWALDITIRNN